LKTKKLILLFIFLILENPAKAAQFTHGNVEAESTDKKDKLSQTLTTADSEYRAYVEEKRNAWVYDQINKNCHNIKNNEFEEVFIRYMRKKHPVESKQVLFDSSPVSVRMTKIFADIFISQEVVPKLKDFYLSYGRCPSLNELNFPY